MAMADAPDAGFFNKWYSDMEYAPRKDEIEQRHLGLPPYLLSTSLLPWEGIAEVTEALRLSMTDVLLDLACGRGGYGLEVAARTGASLVGWTFPKSPSVWLPSRRRRLVARPTSGSVP